MDCFRERTVVVVDVVTAPLVTEKFQMNTDKKFAKTLGLKETLEIVTLLMLSLGAVVRIVIWLYVHCKGKIKDPFY